MSGSSSGSPDRKRARLDDENENHDQAPRPCCSCERLCETGSGHNWVNMGPPSSGTIRFWNRVGTYQYIDWERAVTGDYGTYVPLCRSCMKSIRLGILKIESVPETSDAQAIAINMLAEQLYHKVQKIVIQE
jgi:hypothetical protein